MFAALLLALTAAAPAPFTFSGRVVDPMGAPLADATVAAACVTAPPRAATTDARGEFTLVLPPDHCTVTIAFEGFAPAVLSIDGGEGARESRHFVLQIAGVQEAVSVSAAGHPVDNSTAPKTGKPPRGGPHSGAGGPPAVVGGQIMTG